MEIAVRFSRLKQQADSLGDYAVSLQRYATEVGQIRNQLRTSMKTKSNISTALKSTAENVETCAQAMARMERGLQEIIPIYGACETALAGGKLTQALANDSEQFAEQQDEGGAVASWGDLWKVTKTFGTIGGVVGGIGSIVTGDNWADRAKGVASLVGTGAKAADKIQNGTYGVADLFGFNTINPADAVANKLDDFVISGGKNACSNIAAVAKWAGVALTGVCNFMDNVEEFDGDYGNIRMYQETAVETAVDVGLDIAATAVVGTVLTALGVTAAPAVLVAGAGVLVVWGANALCKWVTGGKDIGEVVADAVCDVSEAIGKAVGDAAKAVTEGAKTVWATIVGWF